MKGMRMNIITNFDKRYSENGMWFSDAAPMSLGMNGFNGKWHCIYYHTNGAANRKYPFTKESFVTQAYTFWKEEMRADDTTVLGAASSNTGDNYVAYAVTYAYFSADTAATFYVKSDDEGSLYINGTLVLSLKSCQQSSVTCTFKKGWNKIEAMFIERAGEDYFNFSQKISSLTNCKGIDCSMIGTKSAKYVGVSSTPNVFKSFAWKENT